ncbi:tyrosine-type recombinase/integrase [Amycolatopsis japonica]|uniref:tyrosine-type recombinase/integrase n=1 Tax=Amycolatopsis japonica TaxID=208439 RepID=UPI0033FF996F
MARRNCNGEGSVYKRKDGNGRWEGAAYLRTVNGRSKRVRVYGRTRAEARTRLDEAKAQSASGTLPDKQQTLGAYLDYWFDNVVIPNLRPTTARRYAMNIRLYLKPALGKHNIMHLTVPMVQNFVNEHLASGHSVRSAQIVQTVLSSALTSAQREELVTRNVARLIRLPTYERADIVPWTKDEVNEYLRVVRAERLAAAFLLLAVYGLRRAEVLGLRWRDVDYQRGVIRVRQQVLRHSGSLHLGPLKTRAGRRDLPLLGSVRRALDKERAKREDERNISNDHELIFTTLSGSPVDPDNFSRSFKRICQSQGLRVIKLHHLRHTAATLLKDLGVPARDAQLILGHSNLSTTQEIYQHGNLETRRAELGKVEEVLAGSFYSRTLPSKLPSSRQIVARFTSIISGGSDWDRTSDLRLMSSFGATFQERLTSVETAGRRRIRLQKCGCVAVNLAVKPKSRFEAAPNQSWRDVQILDRKAWDAT